MRYLSLLVMTDKGESLIDDILEKLRSNTNPFPEALLRYAKLLDTNLEMIEKRKPLHNHHVKDLPEGVVTKLTQIELLLEPNYHPAVLWDIIEDFIRRVTETREDSVLDTALAEFQMKYQKRG